MWTRAQSTAWSGHSSTPANFCTRECSRISVKHKKKIKHAHGEKPGKKQLTAVHSSQAGANAVIDGVIYGRQEKKKKKKKMVMLRKQQWVCYNLKCKSSGGTVRRGPGDSGLSGCVCVCSCVLSPMAACTRARTDAMSWEGRLPTVHQGS